MRDPVPLYTEPAIQIEESDLSDDSEMVQSDGDLNVQVAQLKTELRGVCREMQQMRQSHDRNFERMTEAIGKQADAFMAAFNAAKTELVTKAEFGTVAFQVKFLWGGFVGLMVVVLTMVANALGDGIFK